MRITGEELWEEFALAGEPEPLPPLPGDAAGDDLVVRTDLGEFELVIDGELPREGGYVKALELRLAVAHRKGLKPDSKFESGILIGDVELIFRNGRLYLGKTDYGELELPAKIRIERKGVIVDGKQRGDLPAMKPKSGDEG